MAKTVKNVRDDQKEFLRLFDSFSGRQSRWQVWADFVIASACAISCAVDLDHRAERETLYRNTVAKYDRSETKLFTRLFKAMTDAMDANRDQDFLGQMYMACELGNDHAGQFFTPYNVCAMMAEMAVDEAEERLETEGYAAVTDPACGAGALLVAFANKCRERGIDYQGRILFTGQDMDFVVGMMCYIQLSLQGCAGYVTIGDTLADPQTVIDRKGLFPVDKGNVWYTPMFFHELWHWRRAWAQAELVVTRGAQPPAAKVSAPPERDFEETSAGQLTLF